MMCWVRLSPTAPGPPSRAGLRVQLGHPSRADPPLRTPTGPGLGTNRLPGRRKGPPSSGSALTALPRSPRPCRERRWKDPAPGERPPAGLPATWALRSLREERKHEETLVAMEKENCSLRQVVAEQESKLAEQNQLITKLQETVSQLQAEILSSQRRIHQQQQAQEMIQSQTEALEHREMQTSVALQRANCKFERFRSKVIQATFSAPSSEPPQAELTDEELLEAMQVLSGTLLPAASKGLMS
ncbi:PREDICTED: coiled-coil domain-containing protein 27 [Chaetura pelagica]|uniref:coiled-coil domain-containing protein 27 n=1 Tax=Chaetura pelagica TaxID=8897 RepID=UPI0005231398|nr:PREDICTED: coiled-coil domain-containing protein 27 [Chaetura pelagica]